MGQVGPARLETRGHIRPLIDEALAIAPADDPVLRARLVAKRAMSVPLDETAERIYWADRAWAEATAVDDALALSLAARAAAGTPLAPGHLDEVQDLAAGGSGSGSPHRRPDRAPRERLHATARNDDPG